MSTDHVEKARAWLDRCFVFQETTRIVLAQVWLRPSVFTLWDAARWFLWDVPLFLLVEYPLRLVFGDPE